MLIKLRRPLVIGEGDAKKELSELDLKIEDFTGKDLMFCRREAFARKGAPAVFGVADDDYRLQVASKGAGLTVEQIEDLWGPDFEEVDASVRNFLMGLDSA